MKREKFQQLWDICVDNWSTSHFTYGNATYESKDFCTIKNGIADKIYKKYTKVKAITKDCYFKDNSEACHLSRYKRAAVLMYSVLLIDPFNYNTDGIKHLLLKQRFAFRFALMSIIQDYPQEVVKSKIAEKKTGLFDFKSLDVYEHSGDDFLLSVYKDLFYSEIFENYNVLTMANLLGVISIKCSLLGDLNPLDSE